MYSIYQREITDSFAGNGYETAIVENGTIVAHARGWDNPAVVSDWRPHLVGQFAAGNVTGWRRVRGFELENAQGWAQDVIDSCG